MNFSLDRTVHVIWRQFRDNVWHRHPSSLKLHQTQQLRGGIMDHSDHPPRTSSGVPGLDSRGKRKRSSQELQQAVAADSQAQPISSAEKATGQPKKGPHKPSLERNSTAVVECLVEWPPLFKALERTHKALSLVFTFCCTRKHLATTFDTIRPAVESHIKRQLTIEEVAMIVALRPEGAIFAYVDELTLQLDVRSSERDDLFKAPGSSRWQAFPHDVSVGGWSARETLNEAVPDATEVLVFEFIDGDLKRQVRDKKTGEATRPNRKLREEELKIPVYSQKQMTQLIERRDHGFTNAVNLFLNSCTEKKLDPQQTLQHRAEPFIPKPSSNSEDDRERGPDTIPDDIPKERKPVPDIVQELKNSPWYTGQIVPDGHRVFEPQEPVYGNLEFLLSQNLVNALYNAKSITQLYAHQTEALNALHQGQNVVVATSTSSGKSLIYQLPVLCALEEDYNSRAMYIFPTKALAQDQRRSLKEMMVWMPGFEETVVETFDGDTPMSARNSIRDKAKVLFTNPDMLHITILPQEERWRTFLKNLKHVVGTSVLFPRTCNAAVDKATQSMSYTTTTGKWALMLPLSCGG